MSNCLWRVACLTVLLSLVGGSALAGQKSMPTKDDIIDALVGSGDVLKTRSFRPVTNAGGGAMPSIRTSYDAGAPVYTTHPSVGVPILFDFNSADIRPQSQSELLAVAEALKSPKLQGTKILVEGHTDNIGTVEHNLALSQARADSVRAFLMAQGGIEPERLSSIGKGQTEPAVPNDPASPQNRRVVLVNLSN